MDTFLALGLLFVVIGVGFVVLKVLEAQGVLGKKANAPRDTPPLPPPATSTEPENWPDPPPYVARSGLLSDAELRFAAALEKAIAQVWPDRARILVQVPLACLIQVRPGLNNSEQTRWRNKIDRKTIDFVIVDPALRPIVAVELDDSSHAAERRKQRDGFVEQAMAGAGVRLKRVEGRERYDVAALVDLLERNGANAG